MNKAITSLQRSIDALSQRIGTPSERKPDREMVRYLRGRIAEIQESHKKRSVPKDTDPKTDPAGTAIAPSEIVSNIEMQTSCNDADLRFVEAECHSNKTSEVFPNSLYCDGET